jgi:hypothetical protein
MDTVQQPLSQEAVEARRQFMREYMRNWRKNNPEKVKKHNVKSNARYWEKRALEMGFKK